MLIRNHLQRAEIILEKSREEELFPGAVVLAESRKDEVLELCWGNFTYDLSSKSVQINTMFDLASFTKIFSTVLAMRLDELKLINIQEPIYKYFPEFENDDKKQILLWHILTHTSGLGSLERQHIAKLNTKTDLLDAISKFRLLFPPGSNYKYTDLGYILLGEVVEKVYGKTLDRCMNELILAPLGMNSTFYNPPVSHLDRIAPTEGDQTGQYLQGIVHDEKARLMGGIAGHSGLFSTAGDLKIFLRAYLEILLGKQNSILRLNTANAMIHSQIPSINNSQGLGWFIQLPFMGKLATTATFGHTGFTGVSAFVDIPRELVCIFLTNTVHPVRPETEKREEFQRVRAEIADLAFQFSEPV